MENYRFYFQKANKDGSANGTAYDLETDFPGLRYSSMSGLETVGAVKNVYTENYPEESGTRVWHPSDGGDAVSYENTELTLTVAALGDDRRSQLRAFMDLLHSGRLYYWDTARKLKALVIMTEERTVEKDTLKGVMVMLTSIKLTNLWGIAKPCDDSGNLI